MRMDEKMGSLLQYRDVLEGSERDIYEKLMDYASGRKERLTKLESMLLGLAIEQQKKIEQLQVHG